MLMKLNSDRVINNPLNPIIDITVKILEKLAELDDIKNHKILLYYTEDTVKIVYRVPSNSWGTINLLDIKYFIYNPKYYGTEDFTLSEIDYSTAFSYAETYNNRMFVREQIYKTIRKYVSENDHLYNGGRNKFKTKDFDDIINDFNKIIKELEFKITTNKYNL